MIQGYFGLPGSGKTTFLTMLAQKELKKIRDITSSLYRVKKIGFLSIATQIYRCLDINDQTKEIVQGYRFPNIIERIFCRVHRYCIRPLYYKYFDSWERPDLEDYEYAVWKRYEDVN